jgi:glucose/arabinose dehydrogenase
MMKMGLAGRIRRTAALCGLMAGAGLATAHALPSAMAQAAPPAAAPAGPPAWKQGQPPALANSPLHPHIPSLIGTPAKDIPIDKITLPPGFKIEIWAAGLKEARSLTLGDKGTVFVGNRRRDQVLAVVDRGDHREVKVVAKGLAAPNGVAFSNGTLFVAERERIIRFDDIENSLAEPPQPKLVLDGLPHQTNHFWKFMTMGPDGWLYFNQGSPFNIAIPNYLQATILRVNPQTRILQVYAMGVRNSVGMAFNPATSQLWFTDNGRDWMGDDAPSDELNHAVAQGENFGYPFCHQGDMLDPEFGKYFSCADFVPPDVNLGPQVASLGMRFTPATCSPRNTRTTSSLPSTARGTGRRRSATT